MKYAYQQRRFTQKVQARLEAIDAIVTEYANKGFSLTLRQLFYQLVARGLIENTPKSYGNIGDTVKNGRLAGVIDWDAIEDRTRSVRCNSHWDSIREILEDAADSYQIDKRKTQPIYLECWIEKDAAVGIVEKVTNEFDVPCLSVRGYPSVTALRDAAQRFINESKREERIILYAGDHDPSGLDIPRNVGNTLREFGANVTIKRIGITDEQIEQYNAPPNPAKLTDTRSEDYIKKYGPVSWELDALPPEVLEELFEREISGLTDFSLFREAQRQEAVGRRELLAMIGGEGNGNVQSI